MNISSLQPLNTKYMRITYAAILASILLVASLAISPSLASDDDSDGVVEIFGTGVRSLVRPAILGDTVEIEDCGDGDPNTSITKRIRPGVATYTGIIDGVAESSAHFLRYTCATARTHGSFRNLDVFEEVTVNGRTGAAVYERIGLFFFDDREILILETRNRFLCGTGELEGIHGEGFLHREGSQPRTYFLWVHFGDDHETGFEFLCDGLGNGD